MDRKQQNSLSQQPQTPPPVRQNSLYAPPSQPQEIPQPAQKKKTGIGGKLILAVILLLVITAVVLSVILIRDITDGMQQVKEDASSRQDRDEELTSSTPPQPSVPMTAPSDPAPSDPIPAVTEPAVAPTEPVVAPTEPVAPESLPREPLLYWDFETTDGLTAIERVDNDLVPSSHRILTAEGVAGKALYLDGKYGVQLDMKGLDISDDSYTISFWMYAERMGDFMPIIQLGRNMDSSDAKLPTAWMTFTRGSWAETYPIVWDRNTSIPWAIDESGVFPWIAHETPDTVVGKGEWCLVTLVVDGNRYTCLDDNGERIGTRYYLNGELVFDASAEYRYYQGIAPEILTGSPVEGLIGINYWDSLYKGYIDELTIYDEPLTSGQILTLFQKGDTAMIPGAPSETEPDPIPTTPDITPDPRAIDTLGSTELDLGWWTDNTASYKLADGKTMTIRLNNYSKGEYNWENFVVCLCSVQLSTDVLAGYEADPDYAEYMVFRPDAWGWSPYSQPCGTYTISWADWNEWLELMKDAEVEIVITRKNTGIYGTMVFTGADGTVMTENFEAWDIIPSGAPCYVFIGGERAYIELLSVD